MSNERVGKFFKIARERYRILEKKRIGAPKPWTTDSIFRANRFCNVFREDDRTTQWFRENIRDPLDKTYAINPKIILFSIIAFRWFNRIETWDTIISSGRTLEDIFHDWDSDWIRQELLIHSNPPYITGAYIIKTPDGMNKVDGVLWCIDQAFNRIKYGQLDELISCKSSMQKGQQLLEQSPYLGKFMGYQILADAQHTQLLRSAPDIMSWAQPGPGSTRGIGRIFYNDVNKFRYGSAKDEKEVISLMRTLLLESLEPHRWLVEWPEWDMQTVQNWACEYSKYENAEEGKRLKRKYA